MTEKQAIVTLSPSDHQLLCAPGQSLLEAGLDSGVALPYHCANGSCGDCRATVLSGKVTRIRHHDFTLSEAEKLAGTCLMCSNTAVSDVTLEVCEARSANDMPIQELRARLCHVNRTGSMALVGFKFIRGKALRFLTGQYAQLQFPTGQSFSLPIASCPCNAQYVEFHLPEHGNGTQIIRLIAALSLRDRVMIRGPFGHYTLSSNHRVPRLFIAVDEGFASIQGLLEHVFHLELEAPSSLLWIASGHKGHYRDNLCRSWADAFDMFSYLPAAPNNRPLDLLDDKTRIDLNSGEVYLSGPGEALAILYDQLTSAGVDKQRIYQNATPVMSVDPLN
ncbi:MAG: 2Fe-2S iron-sulfur cluster-binding protein [Granulosicoccus sp.]